MTEKLGHTPYVDCLRDEIEAKRECIERIVEQTTVPDELLNVAKKNDTGKAPMDLLPHSALVEAAKVFGFGAEKYSRFNWRSGFDHSRLIAAALRHIGEYNNGEDTDPESGYSHVAHALCCLLMLQAHIKEDLGTDDRYKGEDHG